MTEDSSTGSEPGGGHSFLTRGPVDDPAGRSRDDTEQLVQLTGLLPSEIEALARVTQANAVRRRNSRGGRSATEHLISALRCLYKRAGFSGAVVVDDDVPGTFGQHHLDDLVLDLVGVAAAALRLMSPRPRSPLLRRQPAQHHIPAGEFGACDKPSPEITGMPHQLTQS